MRTLIVVLHFALAARLALEADPGPLSKSGVARLLDCPKLNKYVSFATYLMANAPA